MMNYSYNSYTHDSDDEEEPLGDDIDFGSEDEADPLEEISDLTLPQEDLELLDDDDEGFRKPARRNK